MKASLARRLTRLYPNWWRERYGEEFQAHLEGAPHDLRTLADVACGALAERIFSVGGGAMTQPVFSFAEVVKLPSAAIPIGMSLMAFALVAGALAVGSAAPQADEGAVAHLWQLLMAGQLPVVAFFVFKWVRRAPRQTLLVLGLQLCAGLASMALVLLFHL